MTNGGKLKQDLIHVAGLNAFWVATDESIRKSARSAVELAWANNYGSVAMPLIGAGVGGKGQDYVLNLHSREYSRVDCSCTCCWWKNNGSSSCCLG